EMNKTLPGSRYSRVYSASSGTHFSKAFPTSRRPRKQVCLPSSSRATVCIGAFVIHQHRYVISTALPFPLPSPTMKTFLQQYETQTRYLLLASVALIGFGV